MSRAAGASPAHFSALLTSLFESIALIISQHQPVVEKYYGPGKMLTVATSLLLEADRLGGRVMANWEEERRVRKKLLEMREYRFNGLGAAAARKNNAGVKGSPMIGGIEEDTVDAREIDGLLAELAMMSGRWQLLRRFLYGRLKVRHWL